MSDDISGAYARKAKIEEKFAPPMRVDPTKTKNAIGNGQFPTEIFHVGKFLKPDARDLKFNSLRQLTDNQGKTEFGTLNANGDELIDYYESKKEKETYLNELRFAEYLLDPNRPDTIKELYSLYPELREAPDQYYQDMITLQWTLRDILREGKIRSKEEHALIMYVCSGEFDLPVFPAWDPTGFILKGTDSWKSDTNDKGYMRGFMNSKSYAVNGLGAVDDETRRFKNTQHQAKAAILRRLYPGLRKASDFELSQITMAQRPGPQGNYAINDNIRSFALEGTRYETGNTGFKNPGAELNREILRLQTEFKAQLNKLSAEKKEKGAAEFSISGNTLVGIRKLWNWVFNNGLEPLTE